MVGRTRRREHLNLWIKVHSSTIELTARRATRLPDSPPSKHADLPAAGPPQPNLAKNRRLLPLPHPHEPHPAPGPHPPTNTLSGLPTQTYPPPGLLHLDQTPAVHASGHTTQPTGSTRRHPHRKPPANAAPA